MNFCFHFQNSWHDWSWFNSINSKFWRIFFKTILSSIQHEIFPFPPNPESPTYLYSPDIPVQHSTYLYSPDSWGPTSLTTRYEVTRSLVWKVARPPKWLGLDQIRANERSVSPFTSTLKLINNLYKKVICHYFHYSGPPLHILKTNKIFFGTDDDISQ